jgi:tRNA dimethylallyltransferase
MTLERPKDDELVVVVGPTASGKTALAVELAERWQGEVVSADSVQIYRRFDVGSGKPTASERARAAHHLVDAADPLDAIDAARFAELAEAAIADVRARGLVPVVCGGTFLWVRALLYGLAEGAPKSTEIRARHQAIAAAEGRAVIHARLAEVDPASAARLAPNDLLRTSRALEVFELTGERMSDLQARHGFARPRRPFRLVGVTRAPGAIDQRIEARVRSMLAAGWVDEVRGLLADGLGEARAMGSVGYKQVREHVEGRLSEGDLAVAIVRATRVLVRRQRTWLRDEAVTWLGP